MAHLRLIGIVHPVAQRSMYIRLMLLTIVCLARLFGGRWDPRQLRDLSLSRLAARAVWR